jgi:hypothetical protein
MVATRRLHYNGKNLVFTVRNAGHAAGIPHSLKTLSLPCFHIEIVVPWYILGLRSSVSDPESFRADPDPVCQLNADPDLNLSE